MASIVISKTNQVRRYQKETIFVDLSKTSCSPSNIKDGAGSTPGVRFGTAQQHDPPTYQQRLEMRIYEG